MEAVRVVTRVPATLLTLLPKWIPVREIIAYDERPWGGWVLLSAGFKVLVCVAGKRLSLQLHHRRSELWIIRSGVAHITLGVDDEMEERDLGSGSDPLLIKRETLHRLEARATNVVLIEMYFGEYQEDDLVRIEDDHGRVGQVPGSVAVGSGESVSEGV